MKFNYYDIFILFIVIFIPPSSHSSSVKNQKAGTKPAFLLPHFMRKRSYGRR